MMERVSTSQRARRDLLQSGGRAVAEVGRAALVVNPTKVGHEDRLRAAVALAMRAHGWDEPLWLETTADDPGRGQARQAVEAGVDLVIACGGDGTVTACAEGIGSSGIPLAILPLGTGNLLARNLGLPVDLEGAIAVALTGVDLPIDAAEANGRPFVVMAGLGLDARMLSDTSEPLKRRLGWVAYALSVIRHLRDRPIRVSMTADNGPARRLRATAVIVGNVGWLRGGLPLMPDARPDDGLLDAVVFSARGLAGWLALVVQVMLRRDASSRLTRVRFRELRVETARPQPWELDGEVMGETAELVIVARPGQLVLRTVGGGAVGGGAVGGGAAAR
jgi:YegS/Rv2252/BmrU family lipid kinase